MSPLEHEILFARVHMKRCGRRKRRVAEFLRDDVSTVSQNRRNTREDFRNKNKQRALGRTTREEHFLHFFYEYVRFLRPEVLRNCHSDIFARDETFSRVIIDYEENATREEEPNPRIVFRIVQRKL